VEEAQHLHASRDAPAGKDLRHLVQFREVQQLSRH
jgi:hypothetical protein